MVSLSQKHFIAILLGVCILSAGIGSSLALLAQEGPAGPAGKRGPAGPEGPEGAEGPSGAAEIGDLEAQVEELRGEVGESADLEGRLEGLEDDVSEIEGVTVELCEELDFFC
ncbi:MAG TPA: hypothetical protein VMS60_07865 [Solirubrobacterales bacterium]|nr:hypothetical protein [Solirubrobacterales bacterium]